MGRPANSEMTQASVLKRGQAQNLSYENDFLLHYRNKILNVNVGRKKLGKNSEPQVGIERPSVI